MIPNATSIFKSHSLQEAATLNTTRSVDENQPPKKLRNELLQLAVAIDLLHCDADQTKASDKRIMRSDRKVDLYFGTSKEKVLACPAEAPLQHLLLLTDLFFNKKQWSKRVYEEIKSKMLPQNREKDLIELQKIIGDFYDLYNPRKYLLGTGQGEGQELKNLKVRIEFLSQAVEGLRSQGPNEFLKKLSGQDRKIFEEKQRCLKKKQEQLTRPIFQKIRPLIEERAAATVVKMYATVFDFLSSTKE